MIHVKQRKDVTLILISGQDYSKRVSSHHLSIPSSPQVPTEAMSTYPPESADSGSQMEEGGVKYPLAHGELYNDTVLTYRWENLNAVLPAKGNEAARHLLHSMSGEARAGECYLHQIRAKLTIFRRACRYHGSFRFWEIDATQSTRSKRHAR